MQPLWNPGIFETIFPRTTLTEQFQAVHKAGFSALQFDLSSAGLDPWNGDFKPGGLSAIAESAKAVGIRIPAVAGTYNMAHPNPVVREEGNQGLVLAIQAASELEASFVTLCTGTRNTESMWHFHTDNATPSAWTDTQESIRRALSVASDLGVTLLIEPEPANVVSNAVSARRMLDEIASPHLRIVLDPANIVLSDRSRDPAVVLEEAFDLLGPDIVFAHAKDLSADGEFCAAGTGIVPWPLYWSLLSELDYSGDVIFHTLTEADVPLALSLLPR